MIGLVKYQNNTPPVSTVSSSLKMQLFIRIRFFFYFDYEIRGSLGILLFCLIPLLSINLVSFEGSSFVRDCWAMCFIDIAHVMLLLFALLVAAAF